MRRLLWSLVVSLSAVAFAACNQAGSPTTSAAASSPPASAPASAPAGSAAPSQAASACQPTDDTANGVAVTIDNFAFSPAEVEAKVGQPVTFTNNESISHGAVLDDDRACSTGSFGKGGSGSLVFSAAGDYPYNCTVHGSSMTGTIKVTE
jgi:plastocyanin